MGCRMTSLTAPPSTSAWVSKYMEQRKYRALNLKLLLEQIKLQGVQDSNQLSNIAAAATCETLHVCYGV